MWSQCLWALTHTLGKLEMDRLFYNILGFFKNHVTCGGPNINTYQTNYVNNVQGRLNHKITNMKIIVTIKK